MPRPTIYIYINYDNIYNISIYIYIYTYKQNMRQMLNEYWLGIQSSCQSMLIGVAEKHVFSKQSRSRTSQSTQHGMTHETQGVTEFPWKQNNTAVHKRFNGRGKNYNMCCFRNLGGNLPPRSPPRCIWFGI